MNQHFVYLFFFPPYLLLFIFTLVPSFKDFMNGNMGQ